MRIWKKFDPVIIIGTFISIALSLTLYITGVDTIISVLIGLVSISISLIIDLIVRNSQIESSVLETIGLNRKLYRDQWFYERVRDIIQAWEQLSRKKQHQLFRQYARMRLQNVRDQLVEMALGDMIVEASDFRVLSILVDGAKETLKATSMVSQGFWKSQVGQNYWNKNLEAIERDVKISRVFIYDEVDEELETALKQMHDAGVDVYLANKADLPIELRLDFVISDETLVVTVNLLDEGQPLEHHISSKPESVLRSLSNYERILWLAQDYESYVLRENAD
jgi:hypothetical protein